MSDVRALLKAKRQEARVSHPLASYTSTNQLRCTACNTIVKHASAWNGHVGSKSHRVNVIKLKELEQEKLRNLELEREEQEQEQGYDIDEQEEQERTKGKRKVDEREDSGEVETKKRKVSTEMDVDGDDDDEEGRDPPSTTTSFPSNFFSDPSRSLPSRPDDSDDDEPDDTGAPTTDPQAPNTATTDPQNRAPLSTIDLEWENFQKAMLAPPPNASDARETYERATIFAEPVLSTEIPEGFPPPRTAQAQASGPSGTIPQGEQGELAEPPEELTEEQLRQKKEQEERELIMDRLMDEEQAQEEADAKVTLLKSRVEALKKRREAAKLAKAKNKS
ncbi:hypothetical protein NLI96_g5791 [Meripilus lineatus]|uniref:Coiled-coil domain-containing protein 16 n=1 Tax=Meripilus lineatus TaxID=2056292 RepID=A0AAD5V7P7_9APHY|nr:hypothetical protein NLI96_g5791 [Physisporinus lineatus]